MTQNFRIATDKQVWQPWNRRAGVPVASINSRCSSGVMSHKLCGHSAECQ